MPYCRPLPPSHKLEIYRTPNSNPFALYVKSKSHSVSDKVTYWAVLDSWKSPIFQFPTLTNYKTGLKNFCSLEITISLAISICVVIKQVVGNMVVWMERLCRGRQVTGGSLMTPRGQCCYWTPTIIWGHTAEKSSKSIQCANNINDPTAFARSIVYSMD